MVPYFFLCNSIIYYFLSLGRIHPGKTFGIWQWFVPTITFLKILKDLFTGGKEQNLSQLLDYQLKLQYSFYEVYLLSKNDIKRKCLYTIIIFIIRIGKIIYCLLQTKLFFFIKMGEIPSKTLCIKMKVGEKSCPLVLVFQASSITRAEYKNSNIAYFSICENSRLPNCLQKQNELWSRDFLL